MVLTHASYYIGASHKRDGRPVQDRAAVVAIDYGSDAPATALLLSDGHGSDDHYRSDIGARLAIEAAAEALPFILKLLPRRMAGSVRRGVADSSCLSPADRTEPDPHGEAAMRMFFTRINGLWAKKVLEHWNTHRPAVEAPSLAGAARAYGCTLVGAVRASDFWLAFQLGDGACVAIDSTGTVIDPIPGDSRCAMGRTTSMCIHGSRDFRYAYGRDIPPALMLCSDGLADCFGSHRDLGEQFLAQVAIDSVTAGFEATENDIAATLPDYSAQYTGDDMSVALWIDRDAIFPLLPSLTDNQHQWRRDELESMLQDLASCEESICDITDDINNLNISYNLDVPDQGTGEIERKMSVLDTLKRQKRNLLMQIDDLNLELDNI